MTEKEYIDITNLARLRDAEALLWRCLCLNEDKRYRVSVRNISILINELEEIVDENS